MGRLCRRPGDRRIGQIVLLDEDHAEEIYLTSIAMAGPVVFVRRLPRTAAAISTLAAVSFVAEYPTAPPVASVVGLMIVCGTAAYKLAGRRSFVLGLPLFALVIGSVFVVNAASPLSGDDAGATSFVLLVLVAASMTFGALYRSRRVCPSSEPTGSALSTTRPGRHRRSAYRSGRPCGSQ